VCMRKRALAPVRSRPPVSQPIVTRVYYGILKHPHQGDTVSKSCKHYRSDSACRNEC
jgi:hypothetical protein